MASEKLVVYKVKREDGKFYSGCRYDYINKKETLTFGEKGKPLDTVAHALSVFRTGKSLKLDTSQWTIEPMVRQPTHVWDKNTSEKFHAFLEKVSRETSWRPAHFLEEIFFTQDFEYPHIVVIGSVTEKKAAIDAALKGTKKDNYMRKTWNGYETVIRFKSMKDLLKFRVAFEPKCFIVEDIREVLS